MPKNKVLMLLENNPYPQDPRVRQESRVLASNGYQVTVIAPALKGQSRHEVIENVHVYRYPAPPQANGALGYAIEFGYSLIVAFSISLYVLFRRGFNIIHAHNPPDILVLIALIYKVFGKKFVFDHHDLAPEMYQILFDGGKKSVYRTLLFFEKLSCKVADCVVETNQSYQENDVERNGISAEKTVIVRNGPKLDWQRSGEPIEGLDREGKIKIGYAGEIGHRDGLDNLLWALHELAFNMKRTDFICFIFGYGDAYKNMTRLADELNLGDYVVFTGWLDFAQVLPSLNKLDICVAPEADNDFNNKSTMIKIMEYMAVAKPIVAFDLKEHHRSADDAAVYVKGNDPKAFAEAIMQLMDDPEKRAELGEKGRTRVETQLAWEHQADKLLKAYERLS